MLTGRLLGGPALVRRVVLVAIALTLDLFLYFISYGTDPVDWGGGTVPFWVVPALLLTAHALFAAFRSPWVGYLTFLLLICLRPLVPTLDPFFGYAVALFLLARSPSLRQALLALAGTLPAIVGQRIGTALISGILEEGPDPAAIAAGVVVYVLLYAATWTVGRLLGRTEGRLNRHQAVAVAAREQAVAEERVRISRELHDSVAHSLTAIVLQSAGARAALRRRAASEEDVAGLLSGIESTASQSMRELHRMLGLLRAAEPGTASGSAEDGVRHGPEQAPLHGLDEITGLVETARASGVDVVTTASGTPVSVDPSIGHTVYRAVQEGLSNVMKHAGPGARAELTLDWLPARLVLSVRNTRGIDSPTASVSGGFGLTGLRERLDVVGGTLQVGPTTDGYLLQVGVPTTAGQDSGRDGGEHDEHGSGHESTAQTPFSTAEGD